MRTLVTTLLLAAFPGSMICASATCVTSQCKKISISQVSEKTVPPCHQNRNKPSEKKNCDCTPLQNLKSEDKPAFPSVIASIYKVFVFPFRDLSLVTKFSFVPISAIPPGKVFLLDSVKLLI